MARQMLVWISYRTPNGATKKIILPNTKPYYEYTNDELRSYVQPGDVVVDDEIYLSRRVRPDYINGETTDELITSYERSLSRFYWLALGAVLVILALLAILYATSTRGG